MIVIAPLFCDLPLHAYLARYGASRVSTSEIAMPQLRDAKIERAAITVQWQGLTSVVNGMSATAVFVPFDGDPTLFAVRPLRPYRRVPFGAVLGNRLVVAVHRTAPIPVEVDAALEGELQRVERWLTRIEEEIRAAGWSVA
jgi:hypothetical protein